MVDLQDGQPAITFPHGDTSEPGRTDLPDPATLMNMAEQMEQRVDSLHF